MEEVASLLTNGTVNTLQLLQDGGGGGGYSHYSVALGVPLHPQPSWTQHAPSCLEVPYGDPQFYYSGFASGLVDGVVGSPGCQSACADTSV